jgi:hypothetical protein
MRRSSLSLCLIFFVVAMEGRATADESKSGSTRSGSIAPGPRIECSLRQKAVEPFDPPSTSAIPSTEQFIAREHFKEDIAPTADVKISWLGATFVRRFAIKVEAAGVTSSLRTHSLSSPSNDREIIAELGDGHETNLADVWCLLRRQANGEDGALKTNSVPNIFLCETVRGNLASLTRSGEARGGKLVPVR